MRHSIVALCLCLTTGCFGWKPKVKSLQEEVRQLRMTIVRNELEHTKQKRQFVWAVKQLLKMNKSHYKHIINNRKLIEKLVKLANTPYTKLEQTKFRKFIIGVLNHLLIRNEFLGFKLFGPGYALMLADFYLQYAGDRTTALKLYTQGIENLAAEMKKNSLLRCGHIKTWSCQEILDNGHYNRACVYALNNEKKKALKDLYWLHKNRRLWLFKFWEDNDFKSLHNHPKYKWLVRKYTNPKKKP